MFRSSNKIINSGLSFPRSPPLAVFAWPGSALDPLRIVNAWSYSCANKWNHHDTDRHDGVTLTYRYSFFLRNDQIQNLLVIRFTTSCEHTVQCLIRKHWSHPGMSCTIVTLSVTNITSFDLQNTVKTHIIKKNRPPAAGRFLITYLFATLPFFLESGILWWYATRN